MDAAPERAGGRRRAVGPLLAFADAALEGAFEAEFHARRLPLDRLYLTVVVCLDVLLLIWKLAPQGRSFACALLATEALAVAALLLWQRRQPAAYLARRSATIAVFVVAHALISQNNQPLGVVHTCAPAPRGGAPPPAGAAALGGQAMFWLHEALLQLIPWTGMFAVQCAVPLKTAVWAQAAAVGALMLPPVAARRLAVSTQLCASAGARYAAAVRLVCSAVGCLLPPVLGAEVQELALRLPESAAVHMVSGLAQLALSFAAPLAVLVRRELRARLEFARARGDAAAVAGLRHRGRSWQLSPIEWSLVGATLWCLSLCAAAALHGPPE